MENTLDAAPLQMILDFLRFFILPAVVIVGSLGAIAAVFVATVLAEIPRHPEMIEDGFPKRDDAERRVIALAFLIEATAVVAVFCSFLNFDRMVTGAKCWRTAFSGVAQQQSGQPQGSHSLFFGRAPGPLLVIPVEDDGACWWLTCRSSAFIGDIRYDDETIAPTMNHTAAPHLVDADPELAAIVADELTRQRQTIELIASENIVSPAVLETQGSVLTNKYAEGYPGRRYYGGCEVVDRAEELAKKRAQALFKTDYYVNVQAHSGLAGEHGCLLGGWRRTWRHGSWFKFGSWWSPDARFPTLNFSGLFYDIASYGVEEGSEVIDYDKVAEIAREKQPKLIIAGASNYSREIDFAKFAAIAKEVGAVFMVDMAHIAGLVAAGVHSSPFGHADIVTTTTHKTLRGPRGGMVFSRSLDIQKKVNSRLFPGYSRRSVDARYRRKSGGVW